MPTHARSVRPLLALALITSLIVAGSPAAAFGRQPLNAATAGELAGAPQPSPDAHDAARVAGGHAADETRDLGIPGIRALDRPLTRSVERRARISLVWVTRASREVLQPKPKSVSRVQSTSAGTSSSGSSRSSSSSSFKGSNHLWIPALGINRSVSFFSCTSSAYPANRVYRWGCAGSNNVYLFGHAYSVFKPLHDAYVRGRLSKGMKVMYADARGHVSTYAVSWWKVTTPDNSAWAYAGQSRPSLTLQTCVGANSQYRLIVRLIKIS